MRYLIVRYFRRAVRRGFKTEMQMDEQVSVSKKVRRSDTQSAAVILDFRDLKVVQASLEGNTIPKDFDRIANYYHKNYPRIIDELCQANGVKIQDPPEQEQKNPESTGS